VKYPKPIRIFEIVNRIWIKEIGKIVTRAKAPRENAFHHEAGHEEHEGRYSRRGTQRTQGVGARHAVPSDNLRELRVLRGEIIFACRLSNKIVSVKFAKQENFEAQ
jgi:hypothetical protein